MLIGQLIAKLQHAAADCGGNLNVIVEGADEGGMGYVIKDVIIEDGGIDIMLAPFDEPSPAADGSDEFSDDEELSHDSNGTA